MKLDMSLNNYALYYGCIIAELGTAPYQRKVITTPMVDAVQIIVPNLRKILSSSFFKNSDSITIFGSTPVWVYLCCIRTFHHKFSYIYYDDGRNIPVLIYGHSEPGMDDEF